MPFTPIKKIEGATSVSEVANSVDKPTNQTVNTSSVGIIGRLKSFDKSVLSDLDLGKKIGASVVKGLFGNTLKTAVQMPQSFSTGALGLAEVAGVEGAGNLRKKISQPINAPILGEVKPLSAVPTDTEAASPKEAFGQAIGMLPEAAMMGAFKMPLADKIPKTALGKLAQSFGVGFEYGALSGGSGAMQSDKSMDEVLGDAIQTGITSGTISMGLTAASMIPSGELARVPKDVANLAKRGKDFAVEKMKALMPYATNIRKVDIKAAQDPDIAPRILERLKVMREGASTGNIQEAEDQLKQMNYDRYRMVYDRAKKNAQGAYDRARSSIEKIYGNKTVGGKDVLENSMKKSVDLAKGRIELGTDNVSPVIKISGDQSGSEVLTDMYRRVQRSGSNPNVKELFELKSDLVEFADDIEQGGRAYRAARLMVDSVDSEINRLTADKSKDMNVAYRMFKEAQQNLRPLWKGNITWDSRLNFVKNLENQSKSGSREALTQLEQIAGLDGFVRKELQASRLARLFSMEKGVTGPRQLDDLVRTGFIGIPAAVGSLFGPIGAGAGAAIGGVALKQAQSPAFWSEVIFKTMRDKGIQITADQSKNLVNSPLFQQTLQAIMSSFGGGEKDKTIQEFYAE